MIEATTYQGVAQVGGLGVRDQQRFVFYMNYLWPGEEGQLCRDGRAMEWCQKFFQHREFACSTTEGQDLLHHMRYPNG